MEGKLFDSELKIMEALWEEGDLTAKRLAERLNEQTGWSKTTTYTVIKKCIEKGAIQRIEPGFLCHPLVTRQQIQAQETEALVNRWYDGAADQLVASMLGGHALSAEQIEQLKNMIDRME